MNTREETPGEARDRLAQMWRRYRDELPRDRMDEQQVSEEQRREAQFARNNPYYAPRQTVKFVS
jgi:hypothetical protein